MDIRNIVKKFFCKYGVSSLKFAFYVSLIFYSLIAATKFSHDQDWYCTTNAINKGKPHFTPYWQCGHRTLSTLFDFFKNVILWTAFISIFLYTEKIIRIYINKVIKFRILRILFKMMTPVVLLVGLICFIWFSGPSEKQRQFQLVPKEFNVTKILYSNEKSWGFGPGGNETGIIVYALPKEIAEEIKAKKMTFFSQLPVIPYKGKLMADWEGVYEHWFETPIGSNWFYNRDQAQFTTNTYTGVYGFNIDIDKDIEKELDLFTAKKGSYYAAGRIGMIIVVPEIGKIFYIYNG